MHCSLNLIEATKSNLGFSNKNLNLNNSKDKKKQHENNKEIIMKSQFVGKSYPALQVNKIETKTGKNKNST